MNIADKCSFCVCWLWFLTDCIYNNFSTVFYKHKENKNTVLNTIYQAMQNSLSRPPEKTGRVQEKQLVAEKYTGNTINKKYRKSSVIPVWIFPPYGGTFCQRQDFLKKIWLKLSFPSCIFSAQIYIIMWQNYTDMISLSHCDRITQRIKEPYDKEESLFQ